MSTISNIQKINSQVSPADLLTNLKKNIDFWSDATQQSLKKTEAYAGGNETSKKELQELNDFLEGPLRKRLMGVYQEENELKSRYLRALEPFYTEGGLHQFIEHHYDVILNPMDDSVAYRKKEPFEKEVGILFVLFKVKKTIETIVTLQNSIDSEEEFPSSFTKEKQQEYLKILKEILKLFFIKFIKKEYLKSIYHKLSEKQLSPSILLKKREEKISYVRDEILEGNEARELFILLFFAIEMSTKMNQKMVNIKFNYLDFELIKNEFLLDWLQRKLKGNKNKDKIFDKYQINNKTLTELIKENPEKEGEILQHVPIEVFNDIAEEVNEIVDEKDKTPVSTLSKNHGELARCETVFSKAKKLARFSLIKMKNLIVNHKILATKKKTVSLKSNFSLEVVNIHDIDFAYFDDNHATYTNKLTFLKKKLGEKQHEVFHNNLWRFFEQIDNNHLIKREEPVKEWAIPFLMKHEKESRLLIIGAEISQKKTESGVKCSHYDFNPYFVFGSNQKDEAYGKFLGTRTAKGIDFFCYSYAEDKVQKEAIGLFELIVAQSKGPVFKMSNLKFNAKKDQVKTEEMLRVDDALI